MKRLMTTVSEWLHQGTDVVLATIIADSGSSPRGAGAQMAINEDGDVTGTIGGGSLEYRVQQLAPEILMLRESQIKDFNLSPRDKDGLGMLCGGKVTVLIQYISSEDTALQELFACGAHLFSQNVDSWLIIDLTDEAGVAMTILTEQESIGPRLPESVSAQTLFTGKGQLIEHRGGTYYSKPLTRSERVFIFGGGHIAQELVPQLVHLDFTCFVFDNLEEFANKELFPLAEKVILGDFETVSQFIDVTDRDYLIIMTRNHEFDFILERQALKLKPSYLGVIGSKTKIQTFAQRLREQGFSQEEIDSIHSPIGIAIKAETPAEIAVSIAAELIMVRAEKRLD